VPESVLLIKSAFVIPFFLSPIIPVDRVRVAMLKKKMPLPPTRLAWKLIASFLVFPACLGLFFGFSGDLPENTHRANVVVSSLLFYIVTPAILFCIMFLSKNTWERALAKYAPKET